MQNVIMLSVVVPKCHLHLTPTPYKAQYLVFVWSFRPFLVKRLSLSMISKVFCKNLVSLGQVQNLKILDFAIMKDEKVNTTVPYFYRFSGPDPM